MRRRDVLLTAGAAVIAKPVSAAPDWTPSAPDRELRVPVRGGSIYVRVNGDPASPRAPVLFVHGGPGSGHAYFLPTLALADERAVILYDQLDAGLSDRPGDPHHWTVERFVSEIDAIRAALNLRHLHLVGSSWGSTVSLEYAARRPAGLVGLTLGGPLISTRSWEASTKAQLATLPKQVRHVIEAHERAGTTEDPAYRAAMESFYARFLHRRPEPAYVTAYRKKTGIKLNPVVYGAMWGPSEIRATGILRDYDGEPLLAKIAAPTMVICGEFDEMSPTVVAPLVKRIPNARLVSVPDAGHSIVGDQPEMYVKAIRDHLARCERDPG